MKKITIIIIALISACLFTNCSVENKSISSTENQTSASITAELDKKKTKTIYLSGEGVVYQRKWVDFSSSQVIRPVKIVIGSGATLIDDYAFNDDCDGNSGEGRNGLDKVEEVIIPDTVTQIGKEAFARLTSLKHIDIPDSVTYIDEAAFTECISLKKTNLPSGLEEIPKEMFFFCKQLRDIKVPKSVKSIGVGAFEFCLNLRKVELPEKLEKIYDEAFFGCKKLSEVIIPKSVKTIEGRAFLYCDNLTIKGYKNTVAEKYAKKNKINFEEIKE